MASVNGIDLGAIAAEMEAAGEQVPLIPGTRTDAQLASMFPDLLAQLKALETEVVKQKDDKTASGKRKRQASIRRSAWTKMAQALRQTDPTLSREGAMDIVRRVERIANGTGSDRFGTVPKREYRWKPGDQPSIGTARPRSLRDVMAQRLNRHIPGDPQGRTWIELLADGVIDLAVGNQSAADLDAATFVRDTVDGKPRQALEFSGPQGSPLTSVNLGVDLAGVDNESLNQLISNVAAVFSSTIEPSAEGSDTAADGSGNAGEAATPVG